MTRIGLVGGEPYERDLIREWLAGAPGVQAVSALVPSTARVNGSACGLDVLVAMVEEHVEEPLRACQALHDRGGPRPIVAILRTPTDGLIRRVVASEVSAIVTIASGPKAIGRAVSVAAQGGAWLDPALSPFILGQLGRSPGNDNDLGLTPKEHAVALRFPRGMTNREIAFELGVSEQTVKSHVRSIYGKLGVTNRSAAAAIVADRASIAAR